MKLVGEQKINATRETVYAALNDTEVLQQCIPGCEEIIKKSDTEMTAVVVLKVGPVKAKFKGAVLLHDLDPPEGYSISGEGKAGPAGSAKGGAKVKLIQEGDATVLHYDVKAQVTGKFAQLGSRLIDSTAKKLSKQFFEKFAEIVETDTVPTEVTNEQGREVENSTGSIFSKPGFWIAVAAVVVIVALYVF